jgi:hypothetical protein
VIEPVDGAGELGVLVADEELHGSAAPCELGGEVPRDLGDPGATPMPGHAKDVDSSPLQLDPEEHVALAEQDGVDGEESMTRMPLAWALRTSDQVRPRRLGAAPSPLERRILRLVVAPTRSQRF